MAGYIFSIFKDSWKSFTEHDLRFGVFSPYCLEVPEDATDRQKKSISKVLVATFGDMVTMKPGDNIYFLSNRKIYGVGKAKKIGQDCKYDRIISPYLDVKLPNDAISSVCLSPMTEFQISHDSIKRLLEHNEFINFSICKSKIPIRY